MGHLGGLSQIVYLTFSFNLGTPLQSTIPHIAIIFLALFYYKLSRNGHFFGLFGFLPSRQHLFNTTGIGGILRTSFLADLWQLRSH